MSRTRAIRIGAEDLIRRGFVFVEEYGDQDKQAEVAARIVVEALENEFTLVLRCADCRAEATHRSPDGKSRCWTHETEFRMSWVTPKEGRET